MSRFVVEPAVAVKWFVPEEHSNPAARLLDQGDELLAADTLLQEAGKVIAAKGRLGEISVDEGIQILQALRSVPLRYQASGPLLEPALEISTGLDITLGHALDLAVALQNQCRLVTASVGLHRKIRETPFAAHVKWVGDLR